MFTCSICSNKTFSDPNDIATHLSSDEHLKLYAESRSNEEMDLSCKPCGMKFNGITPYKQHLESRKHKKKLEQIEFSQMLSKDCSGNVTGLEENINVAVDNNFSKDEEIDNEYFVGETLDLPKQMWSCDVCKRLFSDHATFDRHFNEEDHSKNLTKCNELKIKMQCDDALSSIEKLNSEDREENFQQVVNEEYQYSLSSNDTACNVSKSSGVGNVGNSILENLGNTSENENKYFCNVCKIACSGFIPFSEHMISKRHKKELEKKQMIRLCDNPCSKSENGILMSLSNRQGVACSSQNKTMAEISAMDESSDSSTSGNEYLTGDSDNHSIYSNLPAFANVIKCSVCNVPCSGIIPYQQHIQSQKHTKEVEKKKRYEQIMKNAGDLSRIEFGDNTPEKTNDAGSPNTMVMHSTPQKESTMKSDADGDLISFFEETSSDFSHIAADERNFSIKNEITCDICNIKCTGIVPFEYHMMSTKHKKMVERKKLLEQYSKSQTDFSQTEYKVNSTEANCEKGFQIAFMCHLCGVNCSGPVTYNQHLQSSKHFKMQENKQAMGKLLNSQLQEANIDEHTPPKNVPDRDYFLHVTNDTLDSVHDNSLETTGISDDTSYRMLKCEYCKTSFSGIIPFYQHMKSNKHERQLEKYNMLKEFQKQNPQVATAKPCELKYKSSVEIYNSMGACSEIGTKSLNDSGNEEKSGIEDSIVVIGTAGCEKCGIAAFENETSRDQHFQTKEHLEDVDAFVDNDSAFESLSH